PAGSADRVAAGIGVAIVHAPTRRRLTRANPPALDIAAIAAVAANAVSVVAALDGLDEAVTAHGLVRHAGTPRDGSRSTAAGSGIAAARAAAATRSSGTTGAARVARATSTRLVIFVER